MCDAVQGVCPCPPQRLGEIQRYLSLHWGVSEACEECHGENSGPFPAPVPLPARKLAADLELVKPLLCAAVGCGSDGHPCLQGTTWEFSPTASSPKRTNPDASSLCSQGWMRSGRRDSWDLWSCIRMAVGCCSAGSERWLLSQLLRCWLDPLASARCLLLLTYFHLLCPAHG